MLSVYRHQIVVRVQSPDYCTCTESKLMCVYRVQSVVGLQIVVSVQGPEFCRVKRFFLCVQRPDCCPCKASKLYCTETRLLSEYRDQIAVRIQRPYCCPCTATRLLSVYRGVHIFVCTENNFLSSHELSLFKFKSCLISTLQFLYSKGVPPKYDSTAVLSDEKII